MMKLICIFTGTVLFSFVFAENCFAYIDPGSGSYVLQLLLAALFGALASLKIFWGRIKGFFQSKSAVKLDDRNDD